MSSTEEARAALLDAMIVCANAVNAKPKDLNSTTAERFSLAALHLAEANAWLTAPDQPHGGAFGQQP